MRLIIRRFLGPVALLAGACVLAAVLGDGEAPARGQGSHFASLEGRLPGPPLLKNGVGEELVLYELRDRVFHHRPGGRRATELFYEHVDDMFAATTAEPEVAGLAAIWLAQWQQPLRALVEGREGEIVLTETQVESLLDYTAALKSAGSLELAEALEREEIRMGVAEWAGLSLDEFLTRVDRLSCAPSDTALCLNRGRFRVEAEWRTGQGRTGRARAVPLTDDTGTFWFFDRANVEAIVKVLDACGFNQRFWVFAGGLTDVEVALHVTDSETGTVRRYDNPLGAAFQPVQDTSAFATCSAAEGVAPMHSVPEDRGQTGSTATASCTPGPEVLCLGDGRFRIETRWETLDGSRGSGQAEPMTDDTGYFWFFDADNVEQVVKVLDGCGINDRFWVFGAGLTNVEVVTTVTDTTSGNVRTYLNPQGNPFQPVQDTDAFAGCD